MTASQYYADITFSPLIAGEWIFVIAALTIASLGFAVWQEVRPIYFRGAFFAFVLLLLLNPQLVEEQRNYLKDTVLILEDVSDSQNTNDRLKQTLATSEKIQQKLAHFENVEVHVLKVGGENNQLGEQSQGTQLFRVRDEFLSTFPVNRLAATILITDGQVHDIPSDMSRFENSSPVHTLLSGAKHETDRVLTIEKTPGYGIVGKSVSFKYKVSDYGVPNENKTVVVSIEMDGEIVKRQAARIGKTQTAVLDIPHGGLNHIVLEVEALQNELSLKNNVAIFSVNGVRDRLKVLLVSGEPHMGERSWRNILKSDPSVELVHFTILRPPEKQDGTPLKELSLIPFPIVELFEQKLEEFDLIIFDRYRRRGVLSSHYLANIVKYVENGGALLEAAGPSFATPLSLYRTPLSVVLPGKPTGEIYEEPYIPAVSELGNKHPVTASLAQNGPGKNWGRWFRLIDTHVVQGNILMTGPVNKPLLVLHRQGKGRVAQLMSDHAWLWGRGFDGGGPQSELFRRTAHWLMKEPELEEENLIATVKAGTLEITRQTVDLPDDNLEITMPDGQIVNTTLSPTEDGRYTASIPLNGKGLYRLRTTGVSSVVAVGELNPLEERDVRATEEKIRPVAERSGGGIHWINQAPLPDFKRTTFTGNQSTDLWWGLVANKRYEITGYSKRTLLPELLAIVILLGLLSLMWWRESR